jgi:uncharacterized protein
LPRVVPCLPKIEAPSPAGYSLPVRQWVLTRPHRLRWALASAQCPPRLLLRRSERQATECAAVIAALGLTLLVGLALGTMGSGGSIVMVPVLVYVARLTPGSAVVVSLAVVGGTSLLGAWLRLRAGQFHWRAVKFLSLTGIAGALLGARGTHLVSPQLLMLLFAALMLAVGTTMVRGRGESDRVPTCRPVLCMSIGAVIGVLTGFLGVGGGFLIVPALVFLAGIDTASAIGASLAIIALNALGGLLGHLDAFRPLWPTALLYLLAAIIGMLAGARLGIALPERRLQQGFGAMVLAVGAAIAVATLSAFASG